MSTWTWPVIVMEVVLGGVLLFLLVTIVYWLIAYYVERKNDKP